MSFTDDTDAGLLAAVAIATLFVVCTVPTRAAAQDQSGGAEGNSSGSKLQRSDRMEFDARLIRGERASGAVFLFQRTPRQLPSMVERRRTYLRESVRTLLGEEWAERFSTKRAEALADGVSEDSDREHAQDDEERDDDALRLSVEEASDEE